MVKTRRRKVKLEKRGSCFFSLFSHNICYLSGLVRGCQYQQILWWSYAIDAGARQYFVNDTTLFMFNDNNKRWSSGPWMLEPKHRRIFCVNLFFSLLLTMIALRSIVRPAARGMSFLATLWRGSCDSFSFSKRASWRPSTATHRAFPCRTDPIPNKSSWSLRGDFRGARCQGWKARYRWFLCRVSTVLWCIQNWK